MSTFRPRRDLNLHLLQSLMFTGKDTEVQRGELTCPGLWLDYGRTETRSHFTLTYYLILWGKEKRLADEGGKIDVLYFLLPPASQAEVGHLSYSTLTPSFIETLVLFSLLVFTQSKVHALRWSRELSYREPSWKTGHGLGFPCWEWHSRRPGGMGHASNPIVRVT